MTFLTIRYDLCHSSMTTDKNAGKMQMKAGKGDANRGTKTHGTCHNIFILSLFTMAVDRTVWYKQIYWDYSQIIQ